MIVFNNNNDLNKKKMELRDSLVNMIDNYVNDTNTNDEKVIEVLDKLLGDFKKDINVAKKEEKPVEVEEIKQSVNNSINTEDYKIENNDTLLISEVEGVVKLPYRAEEVEEILKEAPDKYKDENDVIQNVFTRKMSEYKLQFASRYNETIKLVRDREKHSLVEAISLALEMMKKRFLHPAIISACRSLKDLDVYLDCLDKNEIDDFKVFKIKYEVYPMLVKNNRRTQGRHYM